MPSALEHFDRRSPVLIPMMDMDGETDTENQTSSCAAAPNVSEGSKTELNNVELEAGVGQKDWGGVAVEEAGAKIARRRAVSFEEHSRVPSLKNLTSTLLQRKMRAASEQSSGLATPYCPTSPKTPSGASVAAKAAVRRWAQVFQHFQFWIIYFVPLLPHS